MAVTASNVVWITGATSGIGDGLARSCPWPDTKIFSVSRREHPEFETVPFELTDTATWDRLADHVTEVLATFRGERALFIHNAIAPLGHRFVGEGDVDAYREEISANAVSPLVLGDMFLRAAKPAVEAGVDVGLVQMSSASARLAYPGMAVYCAAKASMEQWVRAVRAERELRGEGPWVVAIRPGFVDTPSNRRAAELPLDQHPAVPAIVEAVRTGENMLSTEECASNIWGALAAGAPEKAVLLFGEAVGA
ncbi:MAG TPA: SDR family NAD(P)-dependent oxidoreductase [Acidimicrobiales bacterium]